MHDEVVLKKIKRSVLETAKENKVEIYQIILFGSRVRGDYREDSDWDILVITKEKLDRDKFWKLYTSMKRKLASLKVYGDLLIVSKDRFMEKKTDIGSIIYYASAEGITL